MLASSVTDDLLNKHLSLCKVNVLLLICDNFAYVNNAIST